MNRREAIGSGITAVLAALGMKAVAVEPRKVDMNGGDMGRATTYFHPDPDVVGVFGVEVYVHSGVDRARLEDALRTLKSFGANIYSPFDNGSFPVYESSGYPSTKTIFYFIVPNENKGKV